MEVLLTHEEANRAIEHALKSHDQIQAQEGEADDLKVCIDSAAVLDSRLTAVEWTQIALVALQGTQVHPVSSSARLTAVNASTCTCFSWEHIFTLKPSGGSCPAFCNIIKFMPSATVLGACEKSSCWSIIFLEHNFEL